MFLLFQGGYFQVPAVSFRECRWFSSSQKDQNGFTFVEPPIFSQACRQSRRPYRWGSKPFLLTKNPSQGLFGCNIYQYIIYLKRGGGYQEKIPSKNRHGTHNGVDSHHEGNDFFVDKNTDVFLCGICVTRYVSRQHLNQWKPWKLLNHEKPRPHRRKW